MKKILLQLNLILITSILSLSISYQSHATTYYGIGTGDWNNNATWVTGDCMSMMNTGTYPKAGDIAILCDGSIVTIVGNETCQDLTIGAGTSGRLAFGNGANYTLTITGNILVNAGGIFEYTFNSARQHTLLLTGNFTNLGTVNFIKDGNDYVSTTFTGASNSTISGGGTWTSLGYMTLNKNATTYVVDIQAAGFSTALTNGSTTLNYTSVVPIRGILKHNNTGTLGNIYEPGMTKTDPFIIPANVTFQATQGVIDNPTTKSTYLKGNILIDGGTMNITSGATLPTYEGLLYTNLVTYANLTITSGVLNIYGAISNQGASFIDFNMSGGILNLSIQGTRAETFYITTGCKFTMSGGSIIIHNPSTYDHPLIGPVLDYSTAGATYNVTGGTVQFGGIYSTAAQTFRAYLVSNKIAPNLKINGPTGKEATLIPYDFSNIKALSLTINTGNTFDIEDYFFADVTKKITITSNDGSYAFYNDGTFNSQMGEVEFAGADQDLGGGTVTNFYQLTINNNTTTINNNINANYSLNIKSGKFDLNTYVLTLGLNAGTPGYLFHTAGNWLYGGTFKRYITNATIADGNIAGLFPMGTATNFRPFYLSAPTTAPTTGGYVSVTHTGGNTSKIVSITDGGFTIEKIRLEPWAVTSNLTGGTYNLVAGGTGIPGIGAITDLRLSLFAAVVGTAGTNTGTTADPRVQRTGLTAGQLANTFYIGSVNVISSTLPVELVSFTAKPTTNGITLCWTTASEKNNSYFQIEKSTDGINFNSIATLQGNANTTQAINYQSIDSNPIEGLNYYRLKQVDTNGEIDFSNILSIEWASNGFFVYPIPGNKNGFTTIILPSTNTSVEATIHVASIYGNTYLEKTMPIVNSTISIENNTLSTGIYFLTISTETFTYRKKLIIK